MLNIVRLKSKDEQHSETKILAPIPSISDNDEESAASIESKTAQILTILPHTSLCVAGSAPQPGKE